MQSARQGTKMQHANKIYTQITTTKASNFYGEYCTSKWTIWYKKIHVVNAIHTISIIKIATI
jgi:hypothetical protein